MSEFPETSESLIVQVRDPSNQAAWDQFEQLYRPVIFRIGRIQLGERGRRIEPATGRRCGQRVSIASGAKRARIAFANRRPGDARPDRRL